MFKERKHSLVIIDVLSKLYSTSHYFSFKGRMTVRPKNILETEDSPISVCYQTLPVDDPSENLSPPNKRLRLSLKGQRFLGSLNHSKKGMS